jgi:hypothetical protein
MVAAAFQLLVLSSTIYAWVLVESRQPSTQMGTLAPFVLVEMIKADLIALLR